MPIYSELSIDSKIKKSTKMSVIGINMNIHTKYEVSITSYVGRRAKQRKVP